ncbi:MAG: type IV toxin-antitoxin system AbiEi family antitoxin domain-containing protein [Alkalispirochaeta sp.]
MVFRRLVELTANLHCFSPGMLAAGEKLDQLRVQLSRWAGNNRLIRIHTGWYTLAEPFRKARIDTHVIACTIKQGSYVSLQSALAYHGMIPEYVPETTCITTGRPTVIETPFGRIRYRHMKRDGFFGYRQIESGVQLSFVARPEKALLDLLYLTPGSESALFLRELRLQQTEKLDIDTMRSMASRLEAPRLTRTTDLLQEISA